MDGEYGAQAFGAIASALTGTRGLCAFHAGDLLGPTILSQLHAQGAQVVPVDPPREGYASQLANLPADDPSARCFVGAMWTEHPENLLLLHSRLEAAAAQGYLGYVGLGMADRGSFLAAMTRQLSLPKSVAFQDGVVIPETDKYGLGDAVAAEHVARNHALYSDDPKVVMKALTARGDPNYRSPGVDRDSPLMAAVQRNRADLVEILLCGGADPNVSNGSNSALVLAARWGFVEVVHKLIEHEVDVNFIGGGGCTALDEVAGSDEPAHREIETLLKKHGAVSGSALTSTQQAGPTWETLEEPVSGLEAEADQLFREYLRQQRPEQLEAVLDLSLRALQRTESYAPEAAARLSLHGRALFEAFRLSNRLADLEQAINFQRRAIRVASTEDPDRGLYWSSLGNALLDRGVRLEERDDVREAVTSHRNACALSPDDPLLRSNLSAALLNLFELEPDPHLQSEAIMLLRKIVDEAARGDRHYAMYVGNLADAIAQKARHEGDPAGLAEAQSLFVQALTFDPSPPVRAAILQKQSAAESVRLDLQGEPTSSELAVEKGKEATAAATSPELALRAAKAWLYAAFSRHDWAEVVSAYEQVEAATERLVHEQLWREESESWLTDVQGLAANAAFALVRQNHPVEAALVIEQAQARLITRRLQLEHIEAERLAKAGRPDLQERYEAAVATLRRLDSQSRNAVVDARPRQLALDEIRRVVEEIRNHAGLGDFLTAPTVAQLDEACVVSPLLYLFSTSQGGMAIGLTISPSGLQPWAEDIPSLSTGQVEEALGRNPGFLSAYEKWRSAPRTEASHKQWTRALFETCHWMGRDVLSHVPAARLDLAQVTIIPTGRLALFPWHAAMGPWGTQPSLPTQCLFDRLSVGFSPNARALLVARDLHRTSPKAPPLIVEEPGTGRAELENTPFESRAALDALREIGSPQHLRKTDQATLLDQLRTCGGLHFAGHAASDPADPLRSALDLTNGDRVSLEEILRLRTEGIRFAVLSACETGVSGSRLPEEVVNLPSAFLLARTASVVASLWTVPDLATALLMARFYASWSPAHGSPREALGQAQQWLRDTTNRAKLEFVRPLPESERVVRHVEAWPGDERRFTHPYFWAGFYCTGV